MSRRAARHHDPRRSPFQTRRAGRAAAGRHCPANLQPPLSGRHGCSRCVVFWPSTRSRAVIYPPDARVPRSRMDRGPTEESRRDSETHGAVHTPERENATTSFACCSELAQSLANESRSACDADPHEASFKPLSPFIKERSIRWSPADRKSCFIMGAWRQCQHSSASATARGKCSGLGRANAFQSRSADRRMRRQASRPARTLGAAIGPHCVLIKRFVIRLQQELSAGRENAFQTGEELLAVHEPVLMMAFLRPRIGQSRCSRNAGCGHEPGDGVGTLKLEDFGVREPRAFDLFRGFRNASV